MSSASSRHNSSDDIEPSTSNVKNEVSDNQKTNENNITSNVMSFPDAKWIQIFINGDEHFSGCRCVVNSKYYRNLDMFLNYLTERLKPSFGAVRNIYTPVNGHPVYKLEDLISKHKYVVAGNERFKKLSFGYSDVIDKKSRRFVVKPPKNKFKVSKAKPLCHNALTIYLHENGNFKAKPNKVSLSPQDLENWELIFRSIREIMKCSPIKRIYKLNGKPVQSLEELVGNQSYVIVGKHEVFKAGHYELFSQKTNSSSKETYRSRRSSRKTSSLVTGRSSGVYSQNSAQSSRLGSTISRNKSYPETFLQSPGYNTLKISELGNGVESFDSFLPLQTKLDVINKGSKAKIDLDDDFSGIFRSKAHNCLTEGAVEVDDSSETAVDLPVDLLDAEEVEDDITPDMERSMQHLSLDVPDEIVAFLPSMKNTTKTSQSSDGRQVTSNKYNLNNSQTFDVRNIFV